MDCIEQMERLIMHLPTLVRDAGSVTAFWNKVDEAMISVWDCVETEEMRTEIELRYEDLVEMANALGMIRAEDD